ncbi:MAG: undecaprenyldiphospho-muramoylpentapeptide beta-N-acetylglucosaminyltransferase [Hyphomicrobiales bacterium]|nr:undecaprenyldiphospho-muramoylpentapeptide beta-N-acetylglucosaminyltransferase [Hyphomicrobiales bacterium]MCP5371212.1 undecaprenyldiphospho-muramoylpentapeptide beta-N-acetylglucosaminyltransferase [Hyphomicrobiales bacterium]
MSPRLIALAAGGTGGHVFPAEALAAELAARGHRLALVTDARGGAYKGVLGGLETHHIRAGAVAGRSVVGRVESMVELAIGTWQALGLLKRLDPAAVVGFGGYPSVPTMLAAVRRGCRTVVHEQNAILGRANRLLAGRVARIATSFAQVTGPGGTALDGAATLVHTGMPVRPAITALAGRAYLPPAGDGPVNLLVLGGSQGARVLSDVVPEALRRLDRGLLDRLRLAQQCRPEDLDRVRAAYGALGLDADLAPFFDDVPDRLAAAHLVICRSGASTVAETTALGRPAILVPYPHAADDHQAANAAAVAAAGGGWMMRQDRFTPETLAACLSDVLAEPARLQAAADAARAFGRPDAAARLADLVERLMGANGGREGRAAA